MQIFVPQTGSGDLAPHAQRLELTGDPWTLALPPLCASCGAAADARLVVRKVFRRSYHDRPTTFTIARARVPFCAPCIAQHEREREHPSALARIARRFATEATLPALFAGATGVFFAKEAVRKAAVWGPSHATIPGIVALVCLLIAGASLLAAWNGNERGAIPPQTSVTLALDFGDTYSQLFETPRRTYTVRNAAFADALLAANRDRVWDPASPAAREAGRYRTVMFVAFGILLGAAALWSFLGPG